MKKIKSKRNSFIKFLLSFFAVLTIGGAAVGMGVSKGYAAGTFEGEESLTLPSVLPTPESGNWKILSNNSVQNKVTTTSEDDGCGGKEYTSETAVLILKNTGSLPTVLSFDFSKDNGSIEVTGGLTLSGNSYSGKLGAGKEAKITHTSKSKTVIDCILTLSNMKSEPEIATFTTTFTIDESHNHGSYTVSYDDQLIGTVTSDNPISHTAANTGSYSLVVTSFEEYEICGWSIGGTIYSESSATYPYTASSNATVFPIFKPDGVARFGVGSSDFYYLDQAITAAQSGSTKKIIVKESGKVVAGDYSFPSGVSLLVPFDTNNTDCQGDYLKSNYVRSYTTPSVFRLLTLEDGVTLTFNSNSALSVQSQVSATGQENGNCGMPTGPHGKIYMNQGSVINMESGSKLCCYGFIIGKGLINAKNGSTTYECMQLKDFRGGTCTGSIINNSQKVFPFNQYYIQNIEVKLRFYPGATERLSTAVTVLSVVTENTAFVFIGSTDGLFRLTSGYLEKYYDPSVDRLHFSIHDGAAVISPIKPSIAGKSVDSSKYVMPFHSGLSIDMVNSTISTKQDIAGFPGAIISVDETSIFNIENNANVYIYDTEDCSAWFPGSNYYPLAYVGSGGSTGNGGAPKSRGYAKTAVPDASVDINGTIRVLNGHFYTTTSGADIKSSLKTGKILFQTKSSNSTVYALPGTTASALENTSMTVVNAMLKNGDGSYYSDDVVAGEMILYDAKKDKWITESMADEEIHVLFKDNKNPNNEFDFVYDFPGDLRGFYFPTLEDVGFESPGLDLLRWVTYDDNHFVYKPGDFFDGRVEEDVIFYAYWGDAWINHGNWYQYIYSSTDGTEDYPYGIVSMINPLSNGVVKKNLFAEEGKWDQDFSSSLKGLFFNDSSKYSNGDDNYYYLDAGVVVETIGVYPIVVGATVAESAKTVYCYIGAYGYALTSTRIYISGSEYLEDGFYNIGADGIIHTDSPVSIAADIATYSDGNGAYGHGLFVYNNNYYYAKEDAHIVKASANDFVTFYVERTNNLTCNGELIEPGLYCFDSTGRMCSAPISGNDYIMRAS